MRMSTPKRYGGKRAFTGPRKPDHGRPVGGPGKSKPPKPPRKPPVKPPKPPRPRPPRPPRSKPPKRHGDPKVTPLRKRRPGPKLSTNPGKTARFYRKNKRSRLKRRRDQQRINNTPQKRQYRRNLMRIRRAIKPNAQTDLSHKGGKIVKESRKKNRARGGAKRR